MIFDSSIFIQYGALGAFVIYLIWEKQTNGQKMIDTLERNTQALNNLVALVENKLNPKK